MNPLYNQMQQGVQNNSLVSRFQQFRQSFSGDARQQVQQLLNSGRISQQQYNQTVQAAQQIYRMLGGK